MRVRFSDEAKAKLHTIRAYIAQDSPQNADAMIDRIKADEIEVVTLMHYRQLLPSDLK